MANIPHRFTQEAQDERDWRKKHSRPKSRGCFSTGGDNYDEIDWSKKRGHRKNGK